MEENYIEKSEQEVDTDVKYNRDDASKIIAEVCTMFDTLDDDRSGQIDTIRVVEELLKVKSELTKNEEVSDSEIKPYLKDSAVSRILDTAVAQSYNSTFKKPNSLFDVSVVEDY